MNGPQGDTNHVDLYNIRTGYGHSEFMGRTIANSVVNLWDKTEKIDADGVSFDFELVPIPTNTRGMERVDECTELLRKHKAKELGYSVSLNDLGEWGRISRIYDQPLFVKVPVSCVKAGKLAFVGWGGEPFTEYATVLREAYPKLHIMTACLANAAQGYLPSAAAFKEGGYEAVTTNFTESVAPVLQGCAIEMMKGLL